MRPWPNAEFWRLWAVALALAIAFGAGLLGVRAAHAETMRASFYGAESGRLNADGSRFDPMGLTAASRTLPFGTRLEVCLARCAVVVVRDRGPFVGGRSLDLARGAARSIGLEARGVADIEVRVLGQSAAPAHHHGSGRPHRARRHRHYL